LTLFESPVGQSLPRLETREKLTGQAVYTDDLYRPHMLHGAILHSPYPHARIVGYDIAQAKALPGVCAIVTGDDIGRHYMGPFIKDEPALAKDKVRYIGEPVAAVAAVDIETAQQAARLIDVVYEELPAVFDPQEAARPGAPLLHETLDGYIKTFECERGGNIMATIAMAEGDVDKAWADCDVIVEGVFETQAQNHAYIEPSSALAEVDANGKLTVWSSNQSVFRVQANIAETLALPMSRVRCVTPRVGGAFGGKMESTVQPLTALLALKARKPVRVTLTREEEFEMVRSRHPARIWIKTGARKDGTLVARDIDILLDAGAYADDSPGVAGFAGLISRGPYRIPNVRVRSRAVYTNKLRAGAFRGFGGPQTCFAGETQIDEIAEKIGVDPIDIRMRNAITPGERFLLGQTLVSGGMIECLERVREASDWVTKRKPAPVARPGFRRGIGIAASTHISGLLAAGAIVRILEDGTAVLSTGAVDNGQGSDTALVQIAAASLGLRVDQISYTTPDTDASPYNWGTTASRVTYTAGRAVKAASLEAVEQLKRIASDMFECGPGDVELRPGGRLGVLGVPGKELTFAEISGCAHWVAGGPVVGSNSFVYDGEGFDPKRSVMAGFPFGKMGAWIFAAQVVEIEIDERTGKITPLAVWSAHDVGKAINPGAVEGQIEGGVVQGLGFALFEEMVWDSGKLVNPSLMDYKIAGAPDVPLDIHPIIIEKPEPDGPFGAKGIGEPPIVGIAAAINNALASTLGVRLNKLPMTPERVLRALGRRAAPNHSA
jgi:CO/xanthine dehydrogenase Mo-binding subunit